MNNGKIVSIHGGNISFSMVSNVDIERYEVTLPAGSPGEVDFAFKHLGDQREVACMNGRAFIIRHGDEE